MAHNKIKTYVSISLCILLNKASYRLTNGGEYRRVFQTTPLLIEHQLLIVVFNFFIWFPPNFNYTFKLDTYYYSR